MARGGRSDGVSDGAAATRARILDAAVVCLIEQGVARTTTLAVQHRAGVSRGALLHYFPTHAALLAATVAAIVARNESAVACAQSGRPASRDPLVSALEALAFAARQPAYLAELELWAVSRTDTTLRDALVAVERTARADIDRVSAALFAPWAGSERFGEAMQLTQHFMRGLAVSENLARSTRSRERLILAWAEAIRPLLAPGPSAVRRAHRPGGGGGRGI